MIFPCFSVLSELEEHAAVDLSACQVVGYGILLVGDVGNPVVGVDVVDAEVGDPDNGIEPGTAFEDLPEDWVCPLCGVGKEDFSVEE